ncbi:flagellar biosynthesis protein FlhA [Clostridium argentinense CDC 2741]|uniref:Flagellar biosynthesis protein FlhA n=1 Tax=Clostridium argentinense CDC 2741 TaxID=1418104 RepID=A0A0C1UIJ0_9CLOT|nr:flagellar biosynthesis protein FlhA [Clostridium argentinense]KIE47140.1 flagellar biosynthesis protein FlhA [Clostridium argentinense CDC 2741]NFF40911.1 flagellar biosynthesis protein FlhA [Clostridium argentinense]NFP51378.1 flagellar biosynthesis protein FlhA [Clostridium argentinense]NFP73416.1 flagellar biosynthesis protein FlhA [Clostridium argentinense]NFP78563.1 flagellar biosynthesis protein FlhA [Clostridium argentinense]
MRFFQNFDIKKNSDIIIAFGVIGIVLMIIIPLPPALLDIFLAINIAISVIIMLITMFTTSILQLSVFPTLLLVTTLFRLSLNISSTRLILGDGYAGDIIETFGQFVVRGDYVVGIIIFLIIVIIQFVVITAGAGRVSEVSARFTLDAMPGKQMSIDADLNAGMISEEEARERRKNLQREADFYGAMDGASKFVKGDAIAGIIITIINIAAGIVIGVAMKGWSIGDAAAKYTILTVGDGLVSQIPALLISTSSGILVTRSGSDENFGQQLGAQLTAFPMVIAMASAVLLVLAIIPGMPSGIFILLSAASGYSAYLLHKDEKQKVIDEMETEEREIIETEKREPENVMNLISVEPLEIEIGYGLIPLADDAAGGDLVQRISSVRRQCAIEMGIVVQPIRIRDNLRLKTNEYVIKIRGTVIAKSELMPNMFLCMDPSNEEITMPGIRAIEPTFGIPALWINKDQREEAEIKGLTVVDPTTVMITHLTETIKCHCYELLGRQETKMIIDSVSEKYSTVVEELIPDLMTIGEVQKVLQSLLKEKISIKDMVTILECLADNSRNTRDIELLTEYVRFALGRSICNELVDENNSITVLTLSPDIENMVSNSIQKSVQGSFPAMNPDVTTNIFNSLRDLLDVTYFNNNIPVILVSPKIRPAFRKLIEMVFPSLMVLSLNEIPNDIEIRAEGVVSV